MQEQIENLSKVLSGEIKSTNLPMQPVETYKIVLKGLGCAMMELDGDEINSWSCDFFYTFTKKNQTYILKGSLWYGDYKFSINE